MGTLIVKYYGITTRHDFFRCNSMNYFTWNHIAYPRKISHVFPYGIPQGRPIRPRPLLCRIAQNIPYNKRYVDIKIMSPTPTPYTYLVTTVHLLRIVITVTTYIR